MAHRPGMLAKAGVSDPPGGAEAPGQGSPSLAGTEAPLPRLLGRSQPPLAPLDEACPWEARLTYSTTIEAAADLAASLGAALPAAAVVPAAGDSFGSGSRDSTPIPVLTPVSEHDDPRTCRMDKHLTTWRLPAAPGTMPVYVQRSFRVKTFSLLSLQFAAILAVMMLAESNLPGYKFLALRHQQHTEPPGVQARYLAFVGVGMLVIFSICATYTLRNRYPINYLLLGVVTIAVGLFWGMASVLHDTRLYNQLVAIMSLAMVVATPTSMCLSRKTMDPWHAIISTLLLGWLLASLVVVLVEQRLGNPDNISAAAAVLAALLLLGIFLFNAGSLLVQASPDDFLRVVVTANATLLVVVSLPFMLLAAFVIKACNEDAEAGDMAHRGAVPERAASPVAARRAAGGAEVEGQRPSRHTAPPAVWSRALTLPV